MKATQQQASRLIRNVNFATFHKDDRNCEACTRERVGTVEKFGMVLCLQCANDPQRIERRVLDLKHRIEQLEKQIAGQGGGRRDA